jgi:hypothetical protein
MDRETGRYIGNAKRGTFKEVISVQFNLNLPQGEK